jgi:hypothetical protein
VQPRLRSFCPSFYSFQGAQKKVFTKLLKKEQKKNKMSHFRPTPFTRAFRSLDAFTTDIDVVVEPSPSSSSAPPPPPPPPSTIVMEFEQQTIPMPPTLMSTDVNRTCPFRHYSIEKDTYGLEYELKVLQMKLNWMTLLLFVLVCILVFKRS